MREILFKAKRINNDEWVEGFYVNYKNVIHYILVYDGNGFMWYEIEKETLCQYTGLTDKNGNKIWENDIVSFLDCYSTENGYAEGCCIGKVLWDEETVSFQVTERLSAESYEVLVDCKVIGNIFDNPELKEGAE